MVWPRTARNMPSSTAWRMWISRVQAGALCRNIWPVPWLRLRGELRQGFGGETGETGDLFLDARRSGRDNSGFPADRD